MLCVLAKSNKKKPLHQLLQWLLLWNDVLSFQLVLASHIRALSVDGDNDEADERQYERDVHGWHTKELTTVDDGSLERRQNATAEDGHDETCCAKLRIVAQASKGNAVDGGEHERHTCAYAYETV